jgi:hypothetical protein
VEALARRVGLSAQDDNLSGDLHAIVEVDRIAVGHPEEIAYQMVSGSFEPRMRYIHEPGYRARVPRLPFR